MRIKKALKVKLIKLIKTFELFLEKNFPLFESFKNSSNFPTKVKIFKVRRFQK